ncbi:hypothetical protein AB4142_24700 [Variovorax sp. 2RAF20]
MPPVQDVVDVLCAAGLSLTATGQALKVTPASALTAELRELIRASKAELMCWLAGENAPGADPDRWCWPSSGAMNGTELDCFTVRLARFTDQGLSLIEAEALADKLVLRDRDGDDRRLCLECEHLSGRRCGAWQRASVGTQALPASLLALPQRCAAFDAWRTEEDVAAYNTPRT